MWLAPLSRRLLTVNSPRYAYRIVEAMVAQHVEEFGSRSRGAHDAEHGQRCVPDDQQTAQLKSATRRYEQKTLLVV